MDQRSARISLESSLLCPSWGDSDSLPAVRDGVCIVRPAQKKQGPPPKAAPVHLQMGSENGVVN